MHPYCFSRYGMYMSNYEEPPMIQLNMSGFSGMLATKLLDKIWEDEYLGYEYEPGDENIIELYAMIEITGLSEDVDIDLYLDDEDGE